MQIINLARRSHFVKYINSMSNTADNIRDAGDNRLRQIRKVRQHVKKCSTWSAASFLYYSQHIFFFFLFKRIRFLQILSVLLFVFTPVISTAIMNWNQPTKGAFVSYLFCDDDLTCPAMVRGISMFFHSIGILFAFSFLTTLDLLQISFAMYTTLTLEVSLRCSCTLPLWISSISVFLDNQQQVTHGKGCSS